LKIFKNNWAPARRSFSEGGIAQKKKRNISHNVSVYAMFCGVKRSKIWESEVQRVNRIYCVRRAERSDSGVRVQRALRIFEKFIHIIPFLVGFILLYLIFLF